MTKAEKKTSSFEGTFKQFMVEVRACVGAELRRQRQMLLILNIAALLTPLVILMYSRFIFHLNYVSFPAY